MAVAQGVAQPVRRGVGDQDEAVLADDPQVGAVRPAEDRRREDVVRVALGHDPPVDADDPRQVGGDRVELVGGEHDRDPVGVEVGEQVEDVVAGLEVDAARRLVEEQERRVGDQRAGQEDPLLLAAGQLADVAAGQAADAQPLEQADRRAGRSSAVAQARQRRSAQRPIRTTSRTVAGKFQSTVSSCGTQPTPAVAPRPTGRPSTVIRPSTRGTTPTIARSSVVLPARDGPTIPTNAPRADRQVDVAQDRRAVVAARDAARTGRERSAEPAPGSARRRRGGHGCHVSVTASGSKIVGVAAERADHHLHVLLEHPEVRVLGALRRAGRLVVAELVDERGAGLASRSARGPGSGRPPSRRRRAPSRPGSGRSGRATSCGLGSEKSDAWTAPMTVKPYSRAQYAHESW